MNVAVLKEGARGHQLIILRIIITLVGGSVMMVGLASDWIGLCTVCGEFGKDQILLIVIGLAFALIGLLGSRIVAVYQGTAILLLNTIILLVLLELGAVVWNKVNSSLENSARPREAGEQAILPYYATQKWTAEHRIEAEILEEQYRYHPFVIWRTAPFEGTTINISQEGIRRTPGADCGPNAHKVFVFGGSTMWGVGAPDWGTVAAYLQSGLEQQQKGPVCVVNFGERAYNSAQGVITLMIQLQNDNVPDLVIFYDGINEVGGGYFHGWPPVHLLLDQIAARLESKEQERNPLVTWIQGFESYSLFAHIFETLRPEEANAVPERPTYLTMGIETDELAEALSRTYLNNYRIVDAVSKKYDFEYFFFWQPIISIGQKPLTEDEQVLMSIQIDGKPGLGELTQATFRKVELAVAEHENLYYIAGVFDEQEQQIWIDASHVTPEGNRLVAQKMLQIIKARESLAAD